MTFSSLISGTIPSHGKYNARPGPVTRVIQHHWADTTMGGQNSLASAGRAASVNYLVHNDGTIWGQVPEEFRPWTSGGPAADNPSITIECQDETGAPNWTISAAAEASIVRLLADIAQRHNFGIVNRTNYRGHREFAATACPGPYLYGRLQAICDQVNVLNNSEPVLPPVVGPPVVVDHPVTPTGLAVDGIDGPETKKALQRALGVTADGIVGPVTIKALQRKVGAKADGIWGPLTTKAVQRYLGVTADGIFGPISIRALQTRLNAGTF